MITTTIDWLSFTFHKDVNYEDFISEYASVSESISVPPKFGYSHGFRARDGILFFTNATRQDMGVHVVLSGKTMGALQERGFSIDKILCKVVRSQAKITRLDLAKDATNENISLPELWGEFNSERRRGRTKKFSQVQGSNGGHTIYGGSRESERFLRIYDKAIEQGDYQGDYKRCELECKGDVARALGAMLAESDKWGEIFNGMLKAMVEVNCASFNRFLSNSNAIGLPKINKTTDREKWISNQVIPAIASHLVEFPDSDSVNRLRGMLRIFDNNPL